MSIMKLRLCKLKGAGHCTSSKRKTVILTHVAEAFPPARQGTNINAHRVVGIGKGLIQSIESTRLFISIEKVETSQ